MAEQKLTPWFPPNVKPARPGVYQTEDKDLPDEMYFNLWDGKRWYYGFVDLASSSWYGSTRTWDKEPWPRNGASLKHWRGLAENPHA